MSFNATLYNCSDDPRKLSKTLTDPISVSSITPTENVDLLAPTFILNYNSNYATHNYIVVEAPFNRSYFITDMQIDIGKKIVISCAVDVLETYKTSIKNITANVIRQENLTEPYLPDPEVKIKSGYQNYSYLFPFPVFGQTPAYVLNVMGGENERRYQKLEDPNTPPLNWSTNWADYYVEDAPGVYISVGVPFGFTTAPSYDMVYIAYDGVYMRLW